VQLILGESYRGAMHVVPILLLGFLFLGLYYNVSVWYKITDKTHFGALISIGGATITVILNILLIQRMHVEGSAWAALVCYAFMTIACYWLGRKYYPVPYALIRILIPIVGALMVYWISTMLRHIIGDDLWIVMSMNTLLLIGFIVILYKMEGELIRSIIRR
jgi:O-antigen/teichoic acid export membrane protein